MKDERRFLLLMRLIECPLDNKGIFKAVKNGSKKDFEKYFEYEEKNKEFRQWFDELLKEGIIYNVGKDIRGRGQLIDVYAVDKKKAYNEFKTLKTYKFAIDFFAKRAILGAIEEKP